MAKKKKTRRQKPLETIVLLPLTVRVEALGPDGKKILKAEAYLDAGPYETPWVAIYDDKGNSVPVQIYYNSADAPKTGCTLTVQNSSNAPAFGAIINGIKTDCAITIQLQEPTV
jgi:hypothetical protein